jgi:2-polyprenyl-3-methyl-5-hydroxy-6-metoxy-1,4-benzoquinol methylase
VDADLTPTDRWNHNIHYGLQLLERIPREAADALDVGCGEGWFVRQLRAQLHSVTGIDPDENILSLARAQLDVDGEGIEYLHGDFLAYPFAPASFDVIIAIASLHHMDESAALRRMAELLRPGGFLGIVALARSRTPLDFTYDIAGSLATRAHQLSRSHWETPAPKVWPPPSTYAQLRTICRKILPGCRFRRHTMWRCTVSWTKPTGTQ